MLLVGGPAFSLRFCEQWGGFGFASWYGHEKSLLFHRRCAADNYKVWPLCLVAPEISLTVI